MFSGVVKEEHCLSQYRPQVRGLPEQSLHDFGGPFCIVWDELPAALSQVQQNRP
jgi:hypothetical protein